MLETRVVTPADARLISSHRRAMFAAIGGFDDSTLDLMERSCEPWVARMIREGKYVGRITSEGGLLVASAGLLILDWAPHPLDPICEFRAYLLNVYVEPEYCRRGLARSLVEHCMTEARQRGIRVV